MFTPVLATLGYVVSRDKSRVLMIHRNTRPDDIHFDKYNGLGGKLEPEEDIVTGMRRELLEEAGLVADTLTLRGTVSWPGFGKQSEGWFAFIFRIDEWHGKVRERNHEGTLEWVPLSDLLTLPLWPSDYHFVPLVFDDDPRLFHGCLPYYDGKEGAWSYVRM